MLSKRISSFSLFVVREMKENPTAKYIKFWFCVTFSALSFNRRHFRSGNDNLTYLSKLSLLYAFQANSCCCLNTSSFSFNVSTIFLVCFLYDFS